MLSKQTIKAKNVTPSISAAAIIMAVWMLLATSGCRAMLSTAEAADLADAEAGAEDHQSRTAARRPTRRCWSGAVRGSRAAAVFGRPFIGRRTPESPREHNENQQRNLG